VKTEPAATPEERLSRKVEDVTALILGFFGGDEARAKAWFERENPNLGGQTPNDMIKNGRVAKLLKWVRLQIGDR